MMRINQSPAILQRPSFAYDPTIITEQLTHLTRLEDLIREDPGRFLRLCDPASTSRSEDTAHDLMEYAVGRVFNAFNFDGESETALADQHPLLSTAIGRDREIDINRRKSNPTSPPSTNEAMQSTQEARLEWFGLYIGRELVWQEKKSRPYAGVVYDISARTRQTTFPSSQIA